MRCFYNDGETETLIEPKHKSGKYQGYYPRYYCDLYREQPVACQAEAVCKPCYGFLAKNFF